MITRSERLQFLVHFLAAFVIFLKALVKLEHPEGNWPLITFLFAASFWIVTVTLLHHRLHLPEALVTLSTYAIEAIVLAIVASLYAGEGKHALAVTVALAAAGYTVAFGVYLKRTRAPQS